MRYAAYQLQIDSEVSLGQQLPPGDEADDVPPDVTIRCGPLDDPEAEGAMRAGPFVRARPGRLWIEVRGVAGFQVSDGREIRVDAVPGVDPASLRLFLLGSPFGALLAQRGHLVLHGNSVRIGDACMVCVGPSGAGKSTLAAAFMQRGHEVLADDVVPVDGQGRALAGYPRIKLWQDAAERLHVDTAGLEAVRPQLRKFHVPTPGHFVGGALPVRWIYVLDRHNQPDVVVSPIAGVDRFLPLQENTYRVRFLESMGLLRDHVRQVGALAGKIRMAHVRRPQSGFALDALVDGLLADMAAHP